MFTATSLTWQDSISIIGILLIASSLFYYFAFRKSIMAALGKKGGPVLQTGAGVEDFPYSLIDKPFNSIQQAPNIIAHNYAGEEEQFEILDDDDNILLKEAERVVEEIQATVTHIASNPPNPEEVFSKIRAIVCQYSIFQNTEYFEAINSFVSITVERDCGIKYSSQDLQALWN